MSHRNANHQDRSNDRRQPLKPDHGENFVPGAEEAPEDLAPQSLDHFKRGYKERADLRDREANPLLINNYEHQSTENAQTAPPPYVHSRSITNINEYSNITNNHNTNNHNHNTNNHSNHSNNKNNTNNTNNNQKVANYRNRNIHDNNNHRRNVDGPAGGSVGLDTIRIVDELCRPGCNINHVMERARKENDASFACGKALTAILSNLSRRRNMGVALSVWQWMETTGVQKNVFHYNSLISVCEKMRENKRALRLLDEMDEKGIQKNEVTYSSAISACEKAGEWRKALDLLERMKKDGIGRTVIAYNAAISACEKGLVPHKALEIFDQMKCEGVTPSVITYSAMISAAEKGQQWKLALEVLEEMKAVGFGANVIAYSAAISALSKGQMWEKALELFREIESSGNAPSIVTYNATMSALEKGLQWERALDLFDEMKAKGLPITVVSYGSAISACEKGLQYKQCLEFLDEMTEIGIKKNVVIFGAAMSCMEKSCRADIAFQLMERMKIEGVHPNVHIFNSAISACARCNLWEKGHEIFKEMEHVGVVRDVVSYNAVLDAVCTQVPLARKLFKQGVERGFYSRVSRLGTQWLELDLHFLSLGGGEIALGWWFEECLVPYLVNSSKLEAVKSIDIVTGYGKTRMRGVRHGDDGMRKRVKAMLHFMEIAEVEQPNKGRIHIDKDALVVTVQKNGGKIIFDEDGYRKFKLEMTTASSITVQNVRPKVKLAGPIGEMRNHDHDRNCFGRKHNRHGSFEDGRDRRGSDYLDPANKRWTSNRTGHHEYVARDYGQGRAGDVVKGGLKYNGNGEYYHHTNSVSPYRVEAKEEMDQFKSTTYKQAERPNTYCRGQDRNENDRSYGNEKNGLHTESNKFDKFPYPSGSRYPNEYGDSYILDRSGRYNHWNGEYDDNRRHGDESNEARHQDDSRASSSFANNATRQTESYHSHHSEGNVRRGTQSIQSSRSLMQNRSHIGRSFESHDESNGHDSSQQTPLSLSRTSLDYDGRRPNRHTYQERSNERQELRQNDEHYRFRKGDADFRGDHRRVRSRSRDRYPTHHYCNDEGMR